MNDNDFITRHEVEIALLEKGQKSKRYKLGEIWELNFDEIREALSEYQPKIVRCKDCRFRDDPNSVISEWLPCHFVDTPNNWYCASGRKVRENRTIKRR